jgi:hypothetical protein
MTRDGIMQDVGEKMRGLMSGDFNPEQARALFAFVHEQIKEYCHSKVDQRIFESWLKENWHSKEDQRIFEKRLDEKLDERFNALNTIFHTKEDQKIFEQKMEDRFLSIMEMIKTQSLAINELTKKVDKINEKHSLF